MTIVEHLSYSKVILHTKESLIKRFQFLNVIVTDLQNQINDITPALGGSEPNPDIGLV